MSADKDSGVGVTWPNGCMYCGRGWCPIHVSEGSAS